jgi:hypothetical protein
LSGSDGYKSGERFLRKIIAIVLGCFVISGCAKVSHMDQLLTLKGLADEQTKLNQYVEEQDQNFERMLAEAKAGTLEEYGNKKKIRRAFGEPVFARSVTGGDQELETWLYRYATRYFGADKVYLYFDPDGNLVRTEYIEGKDGKSGEETAPEDGPQEI